MWLNFALQRRHTTLTQPECIGSAKGIFLILEVIFSQAFFVAWMQAYSFGQRKRNSRHIASRALTTRFIFNTHSSFATIIMSKNRKFPFLSLIFNVVLIVSHVVYMLLKRLICCNCKLSEMICGLLRKLIYASHF